MLKTELAEMKELKFYMREYIDLHMSNLPPIGRATILWNVLQTYNEKKTNYMGDRWSFTSDGLKQFAYDQIEKEYHEWFAIRGSYNNG